MLRFLNHYHHAPCNTSWEDEWHCMCNDQCPKCGVKDIEPEESDDRLPEAIAAFLRETPTPRTQITVDAAITWLIIRLGWDAEELGPEYQQGQVETELAVVSAVNVDDRNLCERDAVIVDQ